MVVAEHLERVPVVVALLDDGRRADRGADRDIELGHRLNEVQAALPGSASRTRTGSPGLDLRAGLTAQLAMLGVRKVGTDPRCTLEDPDLFSHRREGRTGRQAAVTWLDPRPA